MEVWCGVCWTYALPRLGGEAQGAGPSSCFQSLLASCCVALGSGFCAGSLEALCKLFRLSTVGVYAAFLDMPARASAAAPSGQSTVGAYSASAYIMAARASVAAPSIARSELRAECAKLKLSQHGLKAGLAQRLLDHYATLDCVSLRQACVRWSVALRGSKHDACQRLVCKLGALAARAVASKQEARVEGGESEADPDWTDDPLVESSEEEPSSQASSSPVQLITSRRVRRKTVHYSPGRSDGSGPADDNPWDWQGIQLDP